MTDMVEARTCFGCHITFATDDEFWHHILNVDCSSSVNTPNIAKNMSCSDQAENGCLGSLPTNSLYFCGLCDKKFVSKEQFLEHSSSSEHNLKSKLTATKRVNDSIGDIHQANLMSIQAKDNHIASKIDNQTSNHKTIDTHEDASIGSNKRISSSQQVLERLVSNYCDSSSPNLNDSHSACKTTDIVSQFHTDDQDCVIHVLRRLCLTQILSLLLNINEDYSGHSKDSCGINHSKYPFNEKDLLELMRAVCKEELRAILPQPLQHNFAA
uniref:Zinc finger, C2H2-type domain-containing protein n=1 Tax=Schistosoma japonicum TaxID=6182 RepID=C1L6X4_SCHJA|nr:Zinc finger, C2H2-type domain-containing protein [Schistosoma japonicum]